MKIFKDGNMPTLIPGKPTFTPVASRLLDILAREDAVVEQVAGLLRLEPEFVAEVLRLANTPVFGFERQIRNLAHVVTILGTRRLRALIATVALRQSGGERGSLYGYWRHSVAAGFLAAEMAPGWGLDPDQAYTAAVMHDHGTWDSRSGLPDAPWSPACDPTDGQAPVGMVGLACGLSEVLGFPTMLHSPAVAGLDEILNSLPDTARRCIPGDIGRLTRVLRDKISAIYN